MVGKLANEFISENCSSMIVPSPSPLVKLHHFRTFKHGSTEQNSRSDAGKSLIFFVPSSSRKVINRLNVTRDLQLHLSLPQSSVIYNLTLKTVER